MFQIKDKKKFYILMAVALLIVVLLTISLAKTYRTYRKDLPSLSQLHNIEPNLSTKLYGSDGKIFKEFYTERRTLIPLREMPPYLLDALLSVEDRKFYHHWGIDLTGTARALATALLRLKKIEGASTITQQLARTLFLTLEKTLTRKIKEALTAIKIERTYSKDEILEMYLNQIYFGEGAYGIQAAAQVFFNKDARELSLPECALLVGVLPSPNRYSPLKNPNLALSRRNLVLKAMKDYGKLTEAAYDSLKALPLLLEASSSKTGLGPYFSEMVRQYLIEEYGEKSLYNGGLSVYTTLNPEMQKAAEEIVKTRLALLQKNFESSHTLKEDNYITIAVDTLNGKVRRRRVFKELQAALVAIDNRTGNILAMVGGKDFTKSEFNRAIQALRQPGSAFKPFVWTSALENGFKPTDIIYDTPVVLQAGDGTEWKPQNFDNTFRGPMTLREGLRISRNIVSVKLIQKITPQEAVKYAHQMGINSYLAPFPSLSLGSSEVNLLEMVDAYSVFPNGGIRVEPKSVLKITDRYGKILEKNSSVEKHEVLDPQTTYIMTTLLQTVIDQGTGAPARAWGFDRPAGGKTGTTDENMDTWFIGFTPQITAGVWVGMDDKTALGKHGTGAEMALPIWTEFMKVATAGMPVLNFIRPEGLYLRTVCLKSGLLATSRCLETATDYFTDKTEPKEYCNLHPSKDLPPPEDKIRFPKTD
ncbi:MAG: PBP1A family penicillin-binding protein [candidate division Zixibacteria bacterium]|nr:PBP1A family penicillin-binding protein [candidate division Zixibacteria bacterium]